MKRILKALVVCIVALAPLVVHGQSYGSIVGSVTDNTGAVVPGATITLKNNATGAVRTEKGTAEGAYRIVNLQPGTYREDVEVSGFKHFTRENITVDPETAYRVDVPLTVGAVTEVVQVTSEAPLIETDSPTLQQVVSEKTVQEMPLNGRNVMNLIAITPGVVAQGGTAGAAGSNQSAGHTNNLGWNNYQIGGGAPGQAAQFLDGAPLNGLAGNEVFLIPNQDSISEFRVGISTVTADFGRYGGGVVNFTSKSGGNVFHGSAYEYFRNKALNANTFFGKRNGTPKPAFNQNQFGGSFGGPIVRDRAFFFANYEQYKIISGATFTALVPTVAERGGNFADLCTGGFDATGVCLDRTSAGVVAHQIYDPYTTVGNASGVGYTRTPFKNNMIPAGRLDSTANTILNVLNYYPAPNTTAGGAAYNFAATREPGVTSKQGGIRADWNASQKQHLFGRYTQWELHDIPVNNYGGITGGAGSDQLTKEGVLGDTYTFTPKLTADLRLSYARAFYDDNPPTYGYDMSTYGPAWASIGAMTNVHLIITPGISGYGAFNGAGIFDHYYRDVYAVAPSVNYLLAKHNLKFGTDNRLMDLEYNGAANPFTFNFTTGFTTNDGTNGGNAVASMLLGAVSSGTVTTPAPTSAYNWYQGYYATDTWQAARKVTVSLGLRYELPGAFAERKDKATVLLPSATNTLGTIGGYNLKGGLFLVNSSNWAPRTTENTRHNLFAPRAGVSWNPVENTVVRAGYGITYIPFDAYDGAAPFNSPVNTAATTMVTSVNNANQIPLNTLSNPLPAGGTVGNTTQSVLQPVGRNQTYLNNLAGLNISGPVPTVRFPYAQQWTASLEQQMPGSALLQIAYAGTRGTFLPIAGNVTNGSSNNLNELPSQYLALGGKALTTAAPVNPFAGQLNSTSAYNKTVTQGQLLRPFPEFGNVVQTNAQGDNIYHSLQVSVQKRFSGGGLISGNYTWAKNLGDVAGTPLTQIDTPGGAGAIGTPQDWNNLRGERTVLNTDIRNRGVIAIVSPLPFGKGRAFLNDVHGVAGGFVNGWEVNSIITFQSGYPVSLIAQANTLNTSFGYGTIRPNYVPGAAGCNATKARTGSAQSRLTSWFNTNCFQAPADFTLGNEARVDGTIHGAGIANYDFSASKDTGLAEHLKLQLKIEMFNLFNRVQFALPSTTVGTATFGTVSTTANQPRQIQLSGRLLF